jgi:hypothetical protein
MRRVQTATTAQRTTRKRSMDNGSSGLTFARVRSRGTQQEEDQTASELSFRPRVERPGSPESTSTPDDTPSIQVRHLERQ